MIYMINCFNFKVIHTLPNYIYQKVIEYDQNRYFISVISNSRIKLKQAYITLHDNGSFLDNDLKLNERMLCCPVTLIENCS